jgi:transcriptional regulator with XRE-family HTH domain
MSITPAECKAARRRLGWSQHDLATRLVVAKDVIRQFESRESLPWALNLIELRRVFEAAGLEFTDDEDSTRLRRGDEVSMADEESVAQESLAEPPRLPPAKAIDSTRSSDAPSAFQGRGRHGNHRR